jgi:hypothetical protein
MKASIGQGDSNTQMAVALNAIGSLGIREPQAPLQLRLLDPTTHSSPISIPGRIILPAPMKHGRPMRVPRYSPHVMSQVRNRGTKGHVSLCTNVGATRIGLV